MPPGGLLVCLCLGRRPALQVSAPTRPALCHVTPRGSPHRCNPWAQRAAPSSCSSDVGCPAPTATSIPTNPWPEKHHPSWLHPTPDQPPSRRPPPWRLPSRRPQAGRIAFLAGNAARHTRSASITVGPRDDSACHGARRCFLRPTLGGRQPNPSCASPRARAPDPESVSGARGRSWGAEFGMGCLHEGQWPHGTGWDCWSLGKEQWLQGPGWALGVSCLTLQKCCLAARTAGFHPAANPESIPHLFDWIIATPGSMRPTSACGRGRACRPPIWDKDTCPLVTAHSRVPSLRPQPPSIFPFHER